MKKFFYLLCLSIALFSFFDLTAQSKSSLAIGYLKSNLKKYQLTEADIAEIKQGYEYTDQHNGVTHVYLVQRYKGVEVYNGEININIDKHNSIINLGNRFVSNIDKKVTVTQASLLPLSAVQNAASNVNLKITEPLVQLNNNNPQAKSNSDEVLFSKAGIALENISAKLLYLPIEDGKEVKLVWKVNIYEISAQNQWDIFVDAQSGSIINKKDNIIHCSFEPHYATDEPDECINDNHLHSPLSPLAANDFNVLNYRLEAPSFGPRTAINSPWNDASADASPFGWLNNGVDPSFTYTRGNNVWAYKDVANQNNAAQIPVNSANAANLDFNFPIDFTQEPSAYQDAAITNLFYANNIMHDIWYNYGFNEVSRNFQNNNNGKGGAQNDYVRAEAQDNANNCKVRNNANFQPTNDGGASRMQMYLWNAGNSSAVVINTPNNIAGNKTGGTAEFGPCLDGNGITGEIVYAIPNDGCVALNNAAAVAGKIALIDRGACNFAVKVKNAQNAGAIAAIVVNNVPGPTAGMGGVDATITIPSLMISQADGAAIKQELMNNVVVNTTLKRVSVELDGDLDNGIIFHEYGHGISTRLTGNNAGCLNNSEQGGEGWSDFFALALTHKPTDNALTSRPMGTYVMGQAPNGPGIRQAPYNTDMAINPRQYGEVATDATTSPHFIGTIWCSALWDMYWYFVKEYGYDPDLYNGTGGNNMAMQLVIDGLKLQPCSPGFLDSRDAILAADMANNNGVNSCYIWNAFARRGMGFSATQGSSNSKADQVAAFDLPPGCDFKVLAVDFVSFTATPKAKSIQLKWETASEINSTGFELQRKSATDNNFVAIAQMPAKGTPGINTYTYEDVNVEPNVRYYYRVVEKDQNNKLTYSNTVQAMIQRASNGFVQVYPNVVSDAVNLKFKENVTGTVSVTITDVAGRVLYNNINKNFSGTNIKLDVSKYAAGPYFVKVMNNDLSETLRIIKK